LLLTFASNLGKMGGWGIGWMSFRVGKKGECKVNT